MRLSAVIFLLVTALANVAAAQEQSAISADQPGFANGSGVVGASTFQLETGAELDRDGGSSLTFPTLLRYGLSDSFELRVESEAALFSHGNADLAPVSLGFKLRLRGGETPVSVIASIQPPSGEGQARSSDFESEMRLVSDIDLGNNFSFTPNVGFSLAEGQVPTGILAATLEKDIGKAAPFVDFELHAGSGSPSLALDTGIAWLAGNDTQLDITAGVGVSGHDFPDWFIGAGVSERF